MRKITKIIKKDSFLKKILMQLNSELHDYIVEWPEKLEFGIRFDIG
jgi:hypothetical protein